MIQRVAFVFSALIVVAFSFPSQTIVEYKPKLNDQFNSKSIDEPLIVIVEEKDSKSSGSVVVQFVYDGNAKDEREGLNSERYNIEKNSKDQSNLNIVEDNILQSPTLSNKTKDVILKEETTSKQEAGKKKYEQQKQSFNKKTEWIPKFNNVASITTKDKYFPHASEAIPPFPEIIYGKPVRETLKSGNAKSETFLLDSKMHERPKFLEPALYPRTVYNTEFDIPFF